MNVIVIEHPVYPERSAAMINNILALFPKNKQYPVGAIIDVMINGIHYEKDMSYPRCDAFDLSAPKHLFITEVTSHYAKLKHDGFLTSTLKAVAHDDTQSYTLTVGRVGVCTFTDGVKHPSEAYVRVADLERKVIRIEGVPNFEDLQYYKTYVEPKLKKKE